ncbi:MULTISPECIES: hypothetical protein [unclassified Nocardiopsis]|uniref:hypothetical protein n=1 Tax=unclassified Nocardiopsis TaxID=2649073 RepID=UPI003407AA48
MNDETPSELESALDRLLAEAADDLQQAWRRRLTRRLLVDGETEHAEPDTEADRENAP